MLGRFAVGSLVSGVSFVVLFDNVRAYGASAGLSALTVGIIPFGILHLFQLKRTFRRAILFAPPILAINGYHDLQIADAGAYAHLPGLVAGLAAGLIFRRGVVGASESTLRPSSSGATQAAAPGD